MSYASIGVGWGILARLCQEECLPASLCDCESEHTTGVLTVSDGCQGANAIGGDGLPYTHVQGLSAMY